MKNGILRKVTTLVLTMALATTCISLVACGKKDTTPKKQEATFEQAFDSSALGGIGLLNAEVPTDNSLMSAESEVMIMSTFAAESQPAKAELSQEVKDNIIKNLEIAKSTMNGAVKSEVKASEKEGYEFMYTISAPDISGNSVVYTFYYNEVPVAPEAEEQPADEKDEEQEEEFNIDGIVILDDVTYTVTGEREVEADEEEFTFTIKFDEKNYVTVEQERGVEGQEFEYTSVKDGVEVFKSEVEYEIDENGEVEMSFETTDENGDEIEYSYEFTKKDGKDIIKVEIEQNEVETEAIINVITDENGKVTYVFEGDEVPAPDGNVEGENVPAPDGNVEENTTPDVAA